MTPDTPSALLPPQFSPCSSVKPQSALAASRSNLPGKRMVVPPSPSLLAGPMPCPTLILIPGSDASMLVWRLLLRPQLVMLPSGTRTVPNLKNTRRAKLFGGQGSQSLGTKLPREGRVGVQILISEHVYTPAGLFLSS